jgi:hypothetical protein
MNAFKALIFVVDYTPFFKLAFTKHSGKKLRLSEKLAEEILLLTALSNHFKASVVYYVR